VIKSKPELSYHPSYRKKLERNWYYKKRRFPWLTTKKGNDHPRRSEEKPKNQLGPERQEKPKKSRRVGLVLSHFINGIFKVRRSGKNKKGWRQKTSS